MPKPTVEFIDVDCVPLATYDHDSVHNIDDVVRLHEYVGSKKAQALIYRVVELPDPKARRKAERECYAIEPITGGPRTRAENWCLVPGSDADKAVAARTPRITERFYPGNIVHISARIKGAEANARFVILSIARDGTVTVTLEGGNDGVSWSPIPVALLTKA